ncbi:maltase A1 [Patella vulgata]|uniref:maltase A1 n=1 Tax=Patella vulgata TaxID=6465 RepID=UPI0021800B24|nr:maltase A1 [Patella vulgata]
MSDENTNNDEKLQLKENLESADNVNAEVDLDDSKAKFINGGKGVDTADGDVRVEIASSSDTSFTGLGKDDLMKYATDPFWVRLRWILFILFWVGWVAMLAAAIVIIVLAPRCPHRPDLKWYNKEVGYQVLTESFQDSNGDGVGDIKGIESRMKYFDELGVKSLWLNSIFKSDNVDGNNGVIDYMEIDPKLGTMEEFQSLTKMMFKKEMRLILDFIPNHTSRNHTWFQKSQTGEAGFEDFYIWADTDNGWKDSYGKSAWEFDTVRNKYYLHQTAKEFPDLNLRNEKVLDELEKIMRFWISKGVYGFNILDAQYLTENENLTAQAADSTVETMNYKDNMEVISKWRAILNSLSDKPGREKVLIATFPGKFSQNDTMEYFGSDDGFNVIPSRLFSELDRTCDAGCLERQIKNQVGSNDKWRGWILGNQNTARAATRFGMKLSKLMQTVQLLLPGTGYVYYGDEIGMKDGDYDASPPVDSYRKENGGTIRDRFRTPMQWDNTEFAGFSSVKPYIPLSADHAGKSVATEKAHDFDGSYNNLDLFKALVKLREEESFSFGDLKVSVIDTVLLLNRKATGFPGYMVAVNLGADKKAIAVTAGPDTEAPSVVQLVFHSGKEVKEDEPINVKDQLATIPPQTAVVFKFIS